MTIKFIYIVSAIGCQCCITCIVFYLCSNVCEGLHNSSNDECPFIFQPSTGEFIQYKTQIRSNYNSLEPTMLAVSTKTNATDAFKLICMVALIHGCDGKPVYPCYCNHTDLHGNHHAVVMVNKTSAHSNAEIKGDVFTTDNVVIFSLTQTLSDHVPQPMIDFIKIDSKDSNIEPTSALSGSVTQSHSKGGVTKSASPGGVTQLTEGMYRVTCHVTGTDRRDSVTDLTCGSRRLSGAVTNLLLVNRNMLDKFCQCQTQFWLNNCYVNVTTEYHIDVVYPPDGVHMKVNGQVANNVTVNNASEVNITCQAGGYPEPGLKIFTGFKSSPKTLQEKRSNSLTWAMNVTCRDRGQYFCSANSTVGQLTTNVTIYVKCAMELLGSTKNNSRFYGEVGCQVSADIDVSGYPDPTSYTLMSDNRTIPELQANSSEGYKYLVNYTKTGVAMGTIKLTLFDLKPDEFRTYYFRVDNGVAGTLTFTFEVLKSTTDENLWVIFLIIFSVVIFMALVCLLVCAFTCRNKGNSKEVVKAVSFKSDYVRSIRRVIDYPSSDISVLQGGNANHYAVLIVHRPASNLDCGYIDVIDDVIDDRGGYSNSMPIIDGGIDP